MSFIVPSTFYLHVVPPKFKFPSHIENADENIELSWFVFQAYRAPQWDRAPRRLALVLRPGCRPSSREWRHPLLLLVLLSLKVIL